MPFDSIVIVSAVAVAFVFFSAALAFGQLTSSGR
jgi:hypothetical protein